MNKEICQEKRLPNFPIAFFSVIMGLSGFTISLTKLSHSIHMEYPLLLDTLTYATTATFAVLLITYLSKLAIFPGKVIEELRHPVKINFFPTISVSLLLLSILYFRISGPASHTLWIIGTAVHFSFSLYIISIWLHHKQYELKHMNPSWLIPAVGNVIVPIAGVHHGYIETSWFFFSIGMMFWIILMTVIIYRVLFHNPLDERLMPTLFILIAPPAVGFISYVNLNGEIDSFARFLIYSGIFLTILMLLKLPKFFRQKFFLSWWAYSFPLAAISTANFLMYQKTSLPAFIIFGSIVLATLAGIICILIGKTIKAVINREICSPEIH